MYKFENEVVDLLLCPLAQDNFRTMKLQELLYSIRHEVNVEQIKDTMQILLKAHDELELFREWKIRGIERDNCWLKRNDFKNTFMSICKRIYFYFTAATNVGKEKDVNEFVFYFYFYF